MAVTSIVDYAQVDTERFVTRVCALIREQYPDYLRSNRENADPLGHAVRRNFLDALRWIRTDTGPAEGDLAAYRSAFLRNAYRGDAVTDVLGSLRLGFQEIWLTLAQAARVLERDDDLATATTRLWRAYEHLAGVAAQAHAGSLRRADSLRHRDLQELWRYLDRPEGDTAARSIARRLDLDPDAGYVAWASRIAIEGRDLGVDRSETLLLADVVIGFTAAERDIGARLTTLATAAAHRCGIGSFRLGLSGLRQSARDAQRALSAAEARHVAIRFTDDLVGCLALDTSLGHDHAVAAVEAAIRNDPWSTELALRFLANGRGLRRTARQFQMHPNTLAYRLQRFWAKAGIDPDQLDDLVRLAFAVRRTQAHPTSPRVGDHQELPTGGHGR